MWRLSEAELYCVRMKMRKMSELMQFDTGISMRRYLPPSGTAGLACRRVSGNKRWPTPPPKMIATTWFMSMMSFSLQRTIMNCAKKYNGAFGLRQSESGNYGAPDGQPA